MIVLNTIAAFSYKQNLILINNNGVTSLDMSEYASRVRVLIKNNVISVICIDDKDSACIDAKNNCRMKIQQVVLTLYNPIKKKLLLFGVGFRSWVVYMVKNKVRYMLLKIGFSRDVCIKIPLDVKIICLKPTLILVRGLNNVKVNQFVACIRSLKVPDPYKGKGIQFINEKIIFKPGKQN